MICASVSCFRIHLAASILVKYPPIKLEDTVAVREKGKVRSKKQKSQEKKKVRTFFKFDLGPERTEHQCQLYHDRGQSRQYFDVDRAAREFN